MITPIPFDLTQKEAITAKWRGAFRWPLSPTKLYDIHAELYRSIILYANSLKSDSRDILLLGRPSELGALVEAAHLVQAEGENRYLFGPEELNLLRGEKAHQGIRGAGHHGKVTGFNYRKARQIIRTMTWSTYKTLIPNLFNPKAIALGHNSLLRDYAKKSGSHVRYRHGDVFFQALMDLASTSILDEKVIPFVDDILANVIQFTNLDKVHTARLKRVIKPFLVDSISRASITLRKLQNATDLPSSIWTGTGAAYPGRALGLEVLRRGGEVWRFDHGGTATLSQAYMQFSFNELAASSHYIMPTKMSAMSEMINNAVTLTQDMRKVEVRGHDGDPGLDVGNAAFRCSKPARRRVLYVSTAFYGFYQTSTPILPGVPYLEWQLRLVEALKLLPVTLTCKPHPEGLLRGKIPPIECLAKTSNVSFERALNENDVLIMDIPASTTFSIALTTDRPIVFFNFGLLRFNMDIQKELTKRCRILTPTYNERNQPLIDQSLLEDAVCGGEDTADPSFFRKLLLGSSY